MGNDFDLDSLASEADQYYQGVMNGRYDYDSFWRRLNGNSLEGIEEMITDYEQKLSKLEKMSSPKLLKKHKIEISKNYLKSQLIELRAVREAKLGIKRQNEEADKVIEKINQKTEALKRLNNYLYSLFPRNYFLSKQKKMILFHKNSIVYPTMLQENMIMEMIFGMKIIIKNGSRLSMVLEEIVKMKMK